MVTRTTEIKQLEKLYIIKEFREMDEYSGTTMMKFEKKDIDFELFNLVDKVLKFSYKK